VNKVFGRFSDKAEFMDMIRECARAAAMVKSQNYTRPITLDDVAKSKIIFDIYIRLKAAAYVRGEIEKGNIKPEQAADLHQPEPSPASATSPAPPINGLETLTRIRSAVLNWRALKSSWLKRFRAVSRLAFMRCRMKFRKKQRGNALAALPLLIISLGLNACYSQTSTKPSLAQLLSKAQKGDSDAQYQLGLLYERGSSEIPPDQVKAVKWFTGLANQGDRRGENALGIAYMHGNGIPEDQAVGFEWFYKAALKGYPPAQFNLAGAYYRGRGTPKNDKEAFEWFVEAAKNGESSAQQTLCTQYQNNRLVEPDPTMAYAWCLVAKQSSNNHLEIVETFLNKARVMLSATELSEAAMLASSWSATHKSGGTMPMHSRSFVSSMSVV
jgi:hypothetical protein